MAETVTDTYSTLVHQDGFWTLIDGWGENSSTLSIGNGITTSTGIIYGLSGLSNYLQSYSPSITLTFSSTGSGSQTFTLNLVTTQDPDDFSASARPHNATTTIVAQTTTTPAADGSLTFVFGEVDGVVNATYRDAWNTHRGRLAARQPATWGGKIAFTVVSTGTATVYADDHSTGTAPSITLSTWQENTGHNAGGNDARGRARHCARSGLPTNTSDLVDDGWRPGMAVRPDWWEREDETFDRRGASETEREVDDMGGGTN